MDKCSLLLINCLVSMHFYLRHSTSFTARFTPQNQADGRQCNKTASLSMEPETKVFVKSKKHSTSAYQWNSTAACVSTYVKTAWNYELGVWWGKRRWSEEGKMGLSSRQTAARHRNRSSISGGSTDFSLLRNIQTSCGPNQTPNQCKYETTYRRQSGRSFKLTAFMYI